jgi:hypothetical protein
VKKFNNQAITPFNVGMNTLATPTPAEYKVLLGHKTTMNTASMKSDALPSKREKNGGYPDSFDWRANGPVQVVKNQGFCGSCCAFAALGAQESMFAIYSKQLFNLSEQNLVDCDTGDYGCGGGNALNANPYVLSDQGGNFVTEDSYRYIAVEGTCKYEQAMKDTYLNACAYLPIPTEEIRTRIAAFVLVALHNRFDICVLREFADQISRLLSHSISSSQGNCTNGRFILKMQGRSWLDRCKDSRRPNAPVTLTPEAQRLLHESQNPAIVILAGIPGME